MTNTEAAVLILSAGLLVVIISFGIRIDRLERRIDKISFGCARGIAVMTPEGNATPVCAP